MVLGDSTAAGTGADRLEETYPHMIASALSNNRACRVHVVNIAASGATVADVEHQQVTALHELKPDLITMSVGANDATHRTSPAQFSRSLKSILHAITASGARDVLVASTPAMSLIPAIQPLYAEVADANARRQNGELLRMAAGSSVRIVDLYHNGRLDYVADPALYASDKFHPSGRGYRKWADLFIQGLPHGE